MLHQPNSKLVVNIIDQKQFFLLQLWTDLSKNYTSATSPIQLSPNSPKHINDLYDYFTSIEVHNLTKSSQIESAFEFVKKIFKSASSWKNVLKPSRTSKTREFYKRWQEQIDKIEQARADEMKSCFAQEGAAQSQPYEDRLEKHKQDIEKFKAEKNLGTVTSDKQRAHQLAKELIMAGRFADERGGLYDILQVGMEVYKAQKDISAPKENQTQLLRFMCVRQHHDFKKLETIIPLALEHADIDKACQSTSEIKALLDLNKNFNSFDLETLSRVIGEINVLLAIATAASVDPQIQKFSCFIIVMMPFLTHQSLILNYNYNKGKVIADITGFSDLKIMNIIKDYIGNVDHIFELLEPQIEEEKKYRQNRPNLKEQALIQKREFLENLRKIKFSFPELNFLDLLGSLYTSINSEIEELFRLAGDFLHQAHAYCMKKQDFMWREGERPPEGTLEDIVSKIDQMRKIEKFAQDASKNEEKINLENRADNKEKSLMSTVEFSNLSIWKKLPTILSHQSVVADQQPKRFLIS